MELKEIEAICATCPELRHALADAFGHTIPLGKLSLKPDGIIDSSLLRETLEEYREISGTKALYDNEDKVEKRIPFLYIVWQDGVVEKSSEVSYRCVGTTCDDWTGDVTHSGEMEWDEDATKPIAHHFISRADIRYLILLEKHSHGWVGTEQRIDSLTIELFFPRTEVNIPVTALSIMASWEEYGHTDYFEDEPLNE